MERQPVRADGRHPDDDLGTFLDSLVAGMIVEIGRRVSGGRQHSP
jgi:hypothetical protein